MNKSKTILVADDFRINVILLKQMLDATPYNVISVKSGTDALEFMKSNHIDLLLLDILMPVMNGYEVLVSMRNNPETKDIPVIITSALSNQQDVELAMAKGANEYLTKPIDGDELLKLVQKYLD